MIQIALFVLAFVVLYLYGTKNFKYWEIRGVKHDKPLPFFGNNLRMFLMIRSISQIAEELYWKYPNEKVVGFYRASYPELVIRDPELVKRILITDFGYFYQRGINFHKIVVEPLLRNLFFADGDMWKLLRQRMTPAFTTGKLKAMFPLIVERAETLQMNAINADESGRVLDARDIMARYTTDFIGACGFGLDANSLNDEKSAFRKLGAKIFDFDSKQMCIEVLQELFPNTFKHLKVMGKVEKEMIDLVKSILQNRNYEPSGRNDFIDLLLECRKKGEMVGDSIENVRPDGTAEVAKMVLDDVLMAAQVFVFFAAGFETSSSATSFTLHQLAFHPGIQSRLQNEIDTVLVKYKNKLCYDAVKEMKYLECAFKEAMRMFPSLGYLFRKSARKYNFPDINLSIDPGVTVVIPLQALQNDPQYFENPEQYRPERFLVELNPKIKYVYLPFGDGPRACIGERLGLMQSLAGLAAVLSRYTVEPAAETLRHPVINPASNIVQSISGGLPLLFRRRS